MDTLDPTQQSVRRKDMVLLGVVSALTILLIARIAECPWGLALTIAFVVASCVSMLAGCVSAHEHRKP